MLPKYHKAPDPSTKYHKRIFLNDKSIAIRSDQSQPSQKRAGEAPQKSWKGQENQLIICY